jgi:hypothetical protein
MTDIELKYKVQAISTALERWNDAEALRLLRLAWGDIKLALERKTNATQRKKPAASEISARKAISPKATSNGSEAHHPSSTRHH